MSMKLRDLIRAVRGCKTAAEERAVITKESALIRTAFKEQDNSYRHRNVAKLLFIHMLGYPTHFGQMECLKLIASTSFPEKRIGYLGLMLLLQDNQDEILTLVTNSLKIDLGNANPFIVGLSLTAIGNIASADMSRDLAIDVDKILKSENDYLRKKASLTAIRIFKKVPELIEDFIGTILSLFTSKNHAVLLTGMQLMIEAIRLDPENITKHFVHLVPSLVKQLRTLLSLGYVPDYDVAGIADPFLQVNTLQLLRLLGKDNEKASDEMNDVLAQVATNTETAKNAGNAILYECVMTIMAIQSESGLKVLAVNILGRFLLNRDNNIRYVALNTLSKVVADDSAAVQRHRNTIVECLKDPDASIRQRALELIYSLVNESNIRTLAREMLNYLVVAPNEQRAILCSKISDAVDRYAPSSRWHIDTKITMLSIAGSMLLNEQISSSLIALIQQNTDMHSYVVHKLYWAVKDDINQISLVHVGVWSIGEYGAELMRDPPACEETLEGKAKVEESHIVDLLEKILKMHNSTDVTKGYILNAMMKLITRFNSLDQQSRLCRFIQMYNSSMVVELQQRSCEYTKLNDSNLGSIRSEVLQKMPVINPATITSRRAKYAREESVEGADDDGKRYRKKTNSMDATSVDLIGGNDLISPKANSTSSSKTATNLLDLDDIFGGSGAAKNPSVVSSSLASKNLFGAEPNKSTATVDLLSDIFSSPSPAPPPVSLGVPTGNDIIGLMEFGARQAQKPNTSTNTVNIKGFEKDGLTMNFELSKSNPADPSVSNIKAIFQNSTSFPMQNLLFQAAFPKYINLQMEPPSSDVVPPHNNGNMTQLVKIQNTLHRQKPIMMRVKIQYLINGKNVDEMVAINAFPADY